MVDQNTPKCVGAAAGYGIGASYRGGGYGYRGGVGYRGYGHIAASATAPSPRRDRQARFNAATLRRGRRRDYVAIPPTATPPSDGYGGGYGYRSAIDRR